ncbi:hypothetical protein JKA73_22345 [Myxococcus xanthus]|nr:hypothetical protein JKA73_22345 [Myxococcus xanthus]
MSWMNRQDGGGQRWPDQASQEPRHAQHRDRVRKLMALDELRGQRLLRGPVEGIHHPV